MIKKALFADELAARMQSELRKIASGDSPDLVKAGECLHAALEIFEDAGLQRQANGVLNVLQKIAVGAKTKPVQKMPSLAELMKHGLTQKDLQQFGEGHHGARAKMNKALRNMGLSEEEIANFIGSHNVMSPEDIQRMENMNRMISEELPAPGEDLRSLVEQSGGPPVPGTVPIDVQFKGQDIDKPQGMEGNLAVLEDMNDPEAMKGNLSILEAARKPKRPDKIHDVHTKGLTPEKQVKNIEHHGTQFNMPDLGWASFDPEAAHALDAEIAEDLNNIDDLLDADLFADDASGANEPLQDFEDEITSRK